MTLSRPTVRKSEAAVTAGLAAPVTIAWADETLIAVACGGGFQAIFMNMVIDPFAKKLSSRVIYGSSGTHIANYARQTLRQTAPGRRPGTLAAIAPKGRGQAGRVASRRRRLPGPRARGTVVYLGETA